MTRQTPRGDRKASPAAREALEVAKTVVYALLIALVLRVVLFQPYTIPSDSMEPALLKGDYIVVSKYSYGWSRYSIPFSPPLFHGRVMGRTPQRGDIIVFQLPRDDKETYIKRLIGLPGDRVQVIGGAVFVNGAPTPRVAIGPTQDPDMPEIPVTQYRETKPNGQSYVTLDEGPGHDGDDTDVYVVPEGHYFFMGDNRDNSLDSRWPSQIGVGFVPAENLVGKAQMILFSWREGASLFKPWTWITHIELGRFFRRLQ
jgi:signal peptidase I